MSNNKPGISRVLNALYDGEINAGLAAFWDSGWDVWIGDEMNGRRAEASFHPNDCEPFQAAADWLVVSVARLYPDWPGLAALQAQPPVISGAPA